MAKVSRRHMTGLCHYGCDRPGTTWDHIVPKSLGGGRGTNLVRACKDCNNDKGQNPPTCMCDRCVRAVTLWLQYQLQLELVKAGTHRKKRLLRFATQCRLRYGVEPRVYLESTDATYYHSLLEGSVG